MYHKNSTCFSQESRFLSNPMSFIVDTEVVTSENSIVEVGKLQTFFLWCRSVTRTTSTRRLKVLVFYGNKISKASSSTNWKRTEHLLLHYSSWNSSCKCQSSNKLPGSPPSLRLSVKRRCPRNARRDVYQWLLRLRHAPNTSRWQRRQQYTAV